MVHLTEDGKVIGWGWPATEGDEHKREKWYNLANDGLKVLTILVDEGEEHVPSPSLSLLLCGSPCHARQGVKQVRSGRPLAEQLLDPFEPFLPHPERFLAQVNLDHLAIKGRHRLAKADWAVGGITRLATTYQTGGAGRRTWMGGRGGRALRRCPW